MKGTYNIWITKHAIEQFRDRILINPIMNRDRVMQLIRGILSESKYVSDNENGILFRNDNLRIEFIVKGRKIITIYQLEKKNGKHSKINR